MTRECFMSFETITTEGKARRGRLTFPRGVVETPAFMPVGTLRIPRNLDSSAAALLISKCNQFARLFTN